MTYQNDPNSPRRDDERYREGVAAERSRSGSSAALGVLLGIILLAILGALAWFFFGQGTTPDTPAEGDTNIINVPTPNAPDAPDAPDVNVTVPSPDVDVPSPEVNAPSPEVNIPSPDIDVPSPEGGEATNN